MVEKSKSSSSKNNSSGLVWTLVKLLLSQTYLIVIVGVFIALVPLKDFPFDAKSYDTPDFEIALSPVLQQPKTAKSRLSYKLDDPKITRKLFFGHPGPEAFAYGLNSFFTGLVDGRIMRIDEKFTKIELFARLASQATSEKCDGKINKPEQCGRPLGLQVHSNKLYVADAVNGLYSIDLQTKQFHHIPVAAYLANVLDREAHKKLLFNDIRFDPVMPSLFYITVSSTRFEMNQLPFSLLEHENSGLLLAVDLANKNGSIIGKDLHFANGAEISSDKQYLYVVETTTFSVSKLNLKQLRENIYASKGDLPKLEPFLVDLPGEPDNIHTHNGRIYVSFSMIRLRGNVISDYLAKVPVVRNFIAKSLNIISKVIYFVRQTLLENKLNYKSEYLKELEYKFFSGHIIYSAVKATGGIAVYDEQTRQLVEVIASNEIGWISHTVTHPKTNELLFGSFKNDFIGVIKPN